MNSVDDGLDQSLGRIPSGNVADVEEQHAMAHSTGLFPPAPAEAKRQAGYQPLRRRADDRGPAYRGALKQRHAVFQSLLSVMHCELRVALCVSTP